MVDKNILNVTTERGESVEIKVYDILDENLYNKTFIIYALSGNENTIFASILNEGENSFSLESITSSDELQYVNSEIETIINDLEA